MAVDRVGPATAARTGRVTEIRNAEPESICSSTRWICLNGRQSHVATG